MTGQKQRPIFIGLTAHQRSEPGIRGKYVTLLGEPFYKIENYDAMEPFFMSLVSSSNHWLFISSTGGLTAGRVNAGQSLFPYYTVDKLTENFENTGNKAILLVTRLEQTSLWEPFSARQQGIYDIERSLYKNIPGTTLVFEEQNHSLGLVYRYAWRTGDLSGFVKTAWLQNAGMSSCRIRLVDGLQNLLPANVAVWTQTALSPLLDAYKRSEVDPQTGLAIFALNSMLTDLAEPSESLLATTVYQLGLDSQEYLLSSRQLDRFRAGLDLAPETEVRGQRGAYFVHASIDLPPGSERSWHLVAEVSQDHAAIVHLANRLRDGRPALLQDLEMDLAGNRACLENLVAAADGLQVSADALRCAAHYANVLFNIMRGGIFADQYRVNMADFREFVANRQRAALQENAAFFASAPAQVEYPALLALAQAKGSNGLARLASAYLPLSFSRRHGDPSRPWNRFSINIKKSDGSKQLDYEGNWRDIFQNWEALAWSYPEYVESMICTFLNATTVDGYNPYRITRQGIDWELPEPHNPWANIGYWSDHQIVYLQKLMEISARVHPGRLQDFLDRPAFSYANVPYRIKPYAALLEDATSTIEFDWELQADLEKRVEQSGTDGKLVLSPDGQVLQASLAEKLLTLLLAKLVNFVPDGGIWMNTQRPEWNDANNALVGKGLSVVTLCYLRRSLVFFRELLRDNAHETLHVRSEILRLYEEIGAILDRFQGSLQTGFDDGQRRTCMDALGEAGSRMRREIYSRGLSGQFGRLPAAGLSAFLELALRYVDSTLLSNRREDHLYHAYNILHLAPGQARISHLTEMLEGQVAILSSGMLSGAESLHLLESLKESRLYQPEQHSYMLYPDRTLPGFLEKNCISPDQVSGLPLVGALAAKGDPSLIVRDENGEYHFSGQIHNAKDVTRILETLKDRPEYRPLVEADAAAIQALFEQVFHHDQFTGRSGTFFAYEGLGSIYWHMVSKLLLAVQETILRTRREPSTPALIARYAELRKGQSYHKPPQVYGAFPTDPYSHTPKGQGAKQPGMTGLVKEEILIRQVELGWSIEDGCLTFDFLLFDRGEFLPESRSFTFLTAGGLPQTVELPAGSLAYSICQVPVVLEAARDNSIQVHLAGGEVRRIAGHVLDAESSRSIFRRDGRVQRLVVSLASAGS